MGPTKTATLFMNGGSQAVRLLKEFRLPGTLVRVSRQGTGVLLEPIGKRDWPRGYWERLSSLAPLPGDMMIPAPLPSSAGHDARLAALAPESEPAVQSPATTEDRPRPRVRGKRPREDR
jgi:antitoxin VapB